MTKRHPNLFFWMVAVGVMVGTSRATTKGTAAK